MSFNHKKATQAINFFATQNGGSISKLHVLKLIFFADRYHLRKYGRPIVGDQYWAMKFGPVASGVKELAELDSLSGDERHYAKDYLERGEREFDVVSKAPVEEIVFSPSDREALAFAWVHFGKKTGIVNITHKYPEWKRHEASLKSTSRVPMSYEDFLLDPIEDVELCHPLTDEERDLRRDELQERAHIEALLS